MKIIMHGDKTVKKIIGPQKIELNLQYRLMKSCVIKRQKENTILYNLLTREMVLLNYEESASLNCLSIKDNEKFEELIQKWFLVPVDYNENKMSNEIRDILHLIRNEQAITHYIILVTTDCNARCYYCYEVGWKHIDMTEETAEQVVSYIEKNSKGNPVELEWFGGEPLCNNKVINAICNGLKKKEVEYVSFIATNGLLLHDEILNKACGVWNLRHAQITLDGTESVYNRTKAYVNVEGSPFELVMDNMKNLLEAGIGVVVRMNIGKDNIDDLLILCDILNERFKKYKDFSTYAEMLFDDKGLCSKKYSEDYKHELYQNFFLLEDKMIKTGIFNKEKASNYFPLYVCSADNPTMTIIEPNGDLGNCVFLRESKPYGNICQDEIDEKVMSYWNNRKEKEQICDNCSLYLECNCLGSCPTKGSVKCTEDLKQRKMRQIHRIMENAVAVSLDIQ